MQKTSIDYLTHTWNPLAMRCTPVSEGCAHCWHIRMADRLARNYKIEPVHRAAYAGDSLSFGTGPVLIEKELASPLRARKPSVIGTQFMGDLFHENVRIRGEEMRRIFRTMLACPDHTFLLLTKRPARMKQAFDEILDADEIENYDNVWLGVSVENQARADERIPILLEIPAAKRWVSVEPMLGPIVLRRKAGDEREMVQMALMGRLEEYSRPVERGIDWVVLGGETGPGARPMHPDWARSVRDQCQAAGVPFYFKHWGDKIIKDGCLFDGNFPPHFLDGREWREMP